MKKAFLLLLLITVITAATTGHAAGDPALEALETLRRGFAGTTDFTAEITQEKQLALMKHKMFSKGVIRFRKPDTFFMELYPPHPSRLLLKNNVMTIRFPDQGTTDRVVLPPEEGLTKWFSYLDKPLTKLPDGVDVKAERQGKFWLLHLFPKAKGGVKLLTLRFDQEGTISRIFIEERNKDRTTLSFDKLRRNVGLQDKDFMVE